MHIEEKLNLNDLSYKLEFKRCLSLVLLPIECNLHINYLMVSDCNQCILAIF